jgi:hypothetical protein
MKGSREWRIRRMTEFGSDGENMDSACEEVDSVKGERDVTTWRYSAVVRSNH